MSKRHQHLRLVTNRTHEFLEEELQGHGRNRGRAARMEKKQAVLKREGKDATQSAKYTKNLVARTQGQAKLLEALETNDLTLAIGPAGTGKTYIAVGHAVSLKRRGLVDRIILTRPAVEAGERIGFLPGDLRSKMDPYMRPLYDALYDWMPASQVSAWLAEGVIEIAPVAFLRGRTLKSAAIVVDEGQNATKGQLKMILTRLGEGSKMIVTGDPEQSDLDEGDSGLLSVAEQLEHSGSGIGVVRLNGADVIRHPVVKRLIDLLAA